MEANNNAKLRDALVCLRDAAREFNHQIRNSKYSGIFDKYTCEKQGFSAALKVVDAIVKANYAINAPARNCDVGTAEEQYKRFMNMCNSKDVRQCAECSMRGFTPGCSRDRCFANWAQMPYEEGGNDGK